MPWRVMVEPLTKSQGDALAERIHHLMYDYFRWEPDRKTGEPGIEILVVDYEED